MEKAILKTLIYSDIFDYPLKIQEIHKWLIGRKAAVRQVEKALEKLRVKGKAERKKDYYFLRRRNNLVVKRQSRQKQSLIYFRKVKLITIFLKIIPWVKLVGISGGLAMENTDKKDDIDLILITAKNRLWISRLLVLGFFSIIGQRRKVGEKGRVIAGKLCVNILLEESELAQSRKDLYSAHEVLQMKVIWQRAGVYFKFLSDNEWVFKFLPNWVGNMENVVSSKYYVLSIKSSRKNNAAIHNTKYMILNTISNVFEELARKFQLWYMKSPQGLERISDGALYFHPEDYRQKVLAKYRKRIEKI